MRGRAVGIADSAQGDRVTIAEELAPGATTRTEYRGSLWTAINVGNDAIPPGATAVIDAIEGLNLRVRLLE
jgi:membrane protein implicated in regulation of membrane protease activity